MSIKSYDNSSHGFTLIELVLVIVLLGILVTLALPRFLSVSEEANLSVVQQTAASFQQGVVQARIKWLTEGRPQGSSATQGPLVDLGGTQVRVDPNLGYPVGNQGQDNINALNIEDCVQVFNGVISHNFTVRRRNQVDDNTFKDFDIIVQRNDTNPDICNYYWSVSLSLRPPSGIPNVGIGFRYFAGSGTIELFDF